MEPGATSHDAPRTNKTFCFYSVIHIKHTLGQTAEQLRHLLNIINAAHMYTGGESPPYCGGGVCVLL